MPVLNNVTVPDQYDPAGKVASIQDVFPIPNGGGWFALASNGNSAFCEVQYGTDQYGTAIWGDETVLGSGAYGTIPNHATGIRFRNAVATKAAVVTAVLVPPDIPVLGVSSLGSVNVVTGATLNFQHNDVFVAAEPTADFEDAANVLSWTVVDDLPSTRVKITPVFPAAVIFPGTIALGGFGTAQLSAPAATTIVASGSSFGVGSMTTNAVGTGPGAFLDSTGRLLAVRTANSSPTIGLGLVGDTQWRFQVDANGQLQWSTGALAADTTLQRNSANTLQLGTTGQHGRLIYFSAGAANSVVQVLVTTDTNPRFTIAGDGTLAWGTGALAQDTSLLRSATIPPSSGQIGLTTQQALQSTNTTGGFVYTAATNSSAFLSFLTAADANPIFKIFTQGALEWGPGGASALDLELARVTNSPTGTGTFLELLIGQGLGYGTGTGGTVTTTNALPSLGTINKATGKITSGVAVLASNSQSYQITNSVVGVDDTIILNWINGGTTVVLNDYWITNVGAGTFSFVWTNSTGGTITPIFTFAVIKGAVA